jgi:hypothetical protein
MSQRPTALLPAVVVMGEEHRHACAGDGIEAAIMWVT